MSSIFNVLDLKCLRISLRMQKYRNVTVTQFKNKARCRVWSCRCTGGSYTPLAAVGLSFLLSKWNSPCALLYLLFLQNFKNVVPEISSSIFCSTFSLSLSAGLLMWTLNLDHIQPCHTLTLHFSLIHPQKLFASYSQ